jgi:NAD(P)-dependent dehydrogenase (short-subunit alcohol dehydrogenase family)
VSNKQVWFITGTSRGMGSDFAKAALAAGYAVAATGRNVARIADALGQSDDLLAVALDVTNRAEAEAAVKAAIDRFGRIDVLVNNAGQGFWGRVDQTTDFSVFEKMLSVNYLSAIWCTVAALPHLKATKGRILAVGSVAGLTGVPLRSAYSAAKHALAGFFDTLRIELEDSGVTVTMISPGFVSTGSQAKNLGVDGQVLGKMPLKPASGHNAEEIARYLLAGAEKRERDVIPGWRAKLGLMLRPLFPGLIDGYTAKAIRGKD